MDAASYKLNKSSEYRKTKKQKQRVKKYQEQLTLNTFGTQMPNFKQVK